MQLKLIKTITTTIPLVDYPIPICEDDILIGFAQMEIEVYDEEN